MLKPIPRIEFHPLVHYGVTHMIPCLPDAEGKLKWMKGHSVNADCCRTIVIKTPAGQIVITHDIIH